ncbi:MAG TPA: oligosaccharide flippase family protein, partial [Candidatus Krumholzibacteria bacterium]|nr:oligosaccharide flippase family protein [Candidatus Krumholzibacteria bacterium]
MTEDIDIKHLRRRATAGARWTGTSTGARIAAQFIQLGILARLLKLSDFGLMAMVNVVLAFALAFADSGVSNAIIHFRDATREELSSLYWLN